MKYHLLAYTILIVLFFITTVSFSQQKNFEFENISVADFNSIKTKDSSVVAEVIADVGYTRFDYGLDGFFLIFERNARIHILKREGASYATIEIPLYKSGNDKEIVTSFKGYTYNLEKGELIKTKVRKEDIFLQEESEHWNIQKVAMPAVKENSIIEFEYEIHSDFTFNLQPWTFQMDIPVYWSEYKVKIPEYYAYKFLSQGYIPFAISDNSKVQQKFTVHYEAESSSEQVLGAVKRTPAHSETFTLPADEYRWVAMEVPAMKTEPFITTVSDYVSKIEFELSVIKIPGSPIEEVMNTWETLNDKLLENADFGLMIKKGDFISDKLPAITGQATTNVEKVNAIFDHVKYRMKWDGTYGIFVNNVPKKVYEERSGSVADINMMLVAILKEAGYDCEPVILSTRNHGRIQETYPILAKFNYVVAVVKIDTSSYLLDATANYLLFNTLPERCLNGKGRVISKKNSRWIQLLNAELKNTFTQVDLNLNEDGSMKGKCTVISAGLDGNDRRNSYIGKNEKEFIEEFTSAHQACTVTDFHILNLDTLEKPLTEIYSLEIPDLAQVAGDRLYLNILSEFAQSTNPFKFEKRVYPVDFSCPIKENYIFNLTIPAGWSVEQLPQATSILLPNKAGFFKCALQENSGVLQIISTLKINKNMFLPEEYDQLKEFFRIIVAKHAEQIVLKKG
jgi:transglutaminase-like putative cysteine protease